MGNRALRSSRWGPLAGVIAVASLLIATPAQADEGLGSFALPSGTEQVWVELEQAGLPASSVIVRATPPGGSTLQLPLTPTTFGLHGELAAGPGALLLEVLPGVGAAAAAPDLAITALDAGGQVLSQQNVRLSIPAGPAHGSGDDPSPAVIGGPIATGGGPDMWWLALVAAGLLAAGASVWVMRSRTTTHEEASR